MTRIVSTLPQALVIPIGGPRLDTRMVPCPRTPDTQCPPAEETDRLLRHHQALETVPTRCAIVALGLPLHVSVVENRDTSAARSADRRRFAVLGLSFLLPNPAGVTRSMTTLGSLWTAPIPRFNEL